MKSTTSYTYKDIWLIAYPILISLIMEQMIGITDTAFLGHVGEIELGASAIAGQNRSQARKEIPSGPGFCGQSISHKGCLRQSIKNIFN